MPPRKKKPNNLQPSKFGIQHFFERTSQKHHHHLQPHTNPTPTINTNTNTKTSNEEKPSYTVLSPQTRFKFSPGMVITQLTIYVSIGKKLRKIHFPAVGEEESG